ncbi:dual adapter for phosphotyrosine and 3-phosphotyrosine and 3-phosphoinositide-like isoform X2 [Dreissena polymorpha]|uniref:dual adapter for phosphotyrosine and 3-phosphotyrosine and 3-phosphoinositide-like isoform X2 n=1 Tax=Dreissena polymorpha TaxID=45954 RepID=UPI0022652A25|nr:dual adapter for phosphotyrosine and 3-phosphotyrosine and 3-phosphoinositide-like isoform X2 [Dreissena polymorpha]
MATYCIRPPRLGARSEGAVKHFKLLWIEDVFQFGHGTYQSCKELERHFNSHPMLAGESGKPTKLEEPYPRDVAEPSIYETVVAHAEGGELVQVRNNKQPRSVNSKDGYLTKQGEIFKTWNVRYFKLQGSELRYFKDSSAKEPLRVLDLDQCTGCHFQGDYKGKHHVFSLTFSWRTFYIFGASDEESKEWVNMINWKLNTTKQEL